MASAKRAARVNFSMRLVALCAYNAKQATLRIKRARQRVMLASQGVLRLLLVSDHAIFVVSLSFPLPVPPPLVTLVPTVHFLRPVLVPRAIFAMLVSI